jgi:symplekin
MSSSTDALSLLTAAVSASDPEVEAESLRMLYKVFQTEPHNLPLLFPTLISVIDRASDTLRQWIVDVIDLTFCKPTLGSQTKASCECISRRYMIQ